MNYALQDSPSIRDPEFFKDSPIRQHYGALMRAVDEVLERDSFDDRPLLSLKNLCLAGAIGEGLRWTVDAFLRFHTDIEDRLRSIVTSGPMFERDPWAEERLEGLLVRHQHIMRSTPLMPS